MKRWIQITAGRGPAECCWVVARVADRIISAAEVMGLRVSVLSVTPGDMPKTFKSTLLSLEGEVGFTGFVRSWEGSILWIGKSMFRSGHKRRNWFVGVAVLMPAEACDQREDQIRIDCMRSSGPGGQHANKTSSAVRVTHIPTGLSTVGSEERSQYHNKKLALARLSHRLRQERNSTRNGQKKDHWQHHNTLLRGNATRVFEGMAFKEKR